MQLVKQYGVTTYLKVVYGDNLFDCQIMVMDLR